MLGGNDRFSEENLKKWGILTNSDTKQLWQGNKGKNQK
ncbi:hypothetical protein L581_1474 [Serratia fonticola AU-AP2C]|nr:hypothetical protein L581_1474 [Serratia fonticola AU-AP2C]